MTDAALDRGMQRGVVAFRWLTLGWAWVGLVLERTHLIRPWLAIGLLVVALAVTALAAGSSALVPAPHLVTAETLVAIALLLGDAVVYDAGRSQSLPWAWPASAVLAAALLGSARLALMAAALLSAASFVGESWLRDEWLLTSSTASKTALLVLAALAASRVSVILREAGAQITHARAREEMGRVLHDGVLQTLAVIQRRSDDPELVALAREQEVDLRGFLRDEREAPTGDVGVALRAVVERIERAHGLTVGVAVADDVPAIRPVAVAALSTAVAEALVNSAKHAPGSRVSLYAEPAEEGVYCSVSDNGPGFHPESVSYGIGIRTSIEAALTGVGGRVSVRSEPGRGTEVELWVT